MSRTVKARATPQEWALARTIAGPCEMGPRRLGGRGSDIYCRCYTGLGDEGWLSPECEQAEKIATALAERREQWEEATRQACTCGGAEPGAGCPACEVYHAIRQGFSR
jgi:hypothetical protein